MPDSLAHFGVKGMHWGVWNEETRRRHMGGHREPGMSSHDSLVKQYRSVGYTKKEAESMAKGHDLAKKVLIGTAVVAGVAIGATVGVALVNKYGNKTLRSGAVLQTLHKGKIDDRLARESFYVSRGKVDNFLYRSRFFDHSPSAKARWYEYNVSKIASTKKIKIAGEHTAAMEFKQVCNTDWNQFQKLFPGLTKEEVFNSSNKKWREYYTNFNRVYLLQPNPYRTKYYDHMKSKGFGGVLDINDSKVAGWTFHPAIIFDNSAFKAVSSESLDSSNYTGWRNVGGMFIEGLRERQLNPMYYMTDTPEGAALMGLGATVAGAYGIQAGNLKSRQNFAERYREEHPNSKLTDAQLRKMYDRQYSL